MKQISKSVLFFALIFIATKNKAQLSGIYTIPGSFPSIAAVINTLNLTGVAGAATINIAAGYTETAPAGGFKLLNPVGSSVTNSVVFQKSGAGANPLITAYTGTATPASAVQDGVWWLIGADYIIIDGIDINDPNTTNPATMEFGYGFYKASATDGCQNNTIKNCVITLNRINSVPNGGGYIAGGSRGIDMVCATQTQNTTLLLASSPAGANSFNRLYANTIKNCHYGIAISGNVSNNTNLDQLNDVGGLSAVTGNTVINFGGGNGSASAGIIAQYQNVINLSNNVLNNNNGSGASPSNSLSAIRALFTGTTTVLNNTITLSITSGTSNIEGIYNKNYGLVNINNNVFPALTFSPSPSSNLCCLLCDESISGTININANSFNNINASGPLRVIYSLNPNVSTSTSTCSINSNTITNLITTDNYIYLLSHGHPYQTLSGNIIDGITSQGNTIVYGIAGVGTATNLTISNNKIRNISAIAVNAVDEALFTSVKTISGNEIYNISSLPSAAYGLTGTLINIDGTCAQLTINGNSIYSVSSIGTATNNLGNLTGINAKAINADIYQNKIAGLLSNGTGSVIGLRTNNGYYAISNNLIGDLNITNSGLADAVTAMSITSSSYIYYNTVYLNNTAGSGSNYGTTVLNASASTSITLRNNILVNTSAATGTGVSTVFKRATTGLTTYTTTSNNNLLYAGTPSVSHIIFDNGTNTYTTLAAFKIFVAPREAQSVTENPPFISTNPLSANYLNINPAIATQVEGGALPVSYPTQYTVDYIGTARNTVTPDIGAWEGNYLQEDTRPPAIVNLGYTSGPCGLSGRTMTVSLSDVSGVATGSLAPRLYYRVNFAPAYTSVQGVLSSGTTTNGVWTFNLAYTAVPADVIFYFLALQDHSNLVNFTLVPSAGSTASDVNNITVPPLPASSYTIEIIPTISVNSGTICSGRSFTIAPTGAATYSYAGGSAIVNPVVNTTYTVTGASQGGCPSANTATASVTVLASPTITVNSASICLGQTLTLNPTGALTYTYSGGSQFVSPVTTSTYAVIGSNSQGCVSAAVISTVVINTVTITGSTSQTTICRGNALTLSGSGGVTYTWSAGVTDNVPFYPSATNIYTLTGTGANGCKGTYVLLVTVDQLPSLSLSASQQTICNGEHVTLTVSGAANYNWQPEGGSLAQANVTPSVTTAYTVTGTDFRSCTSSSVITVNVNTCLGLSEEQAERNVTVYPNPSNGRINIDANGVGQQLTVKIYNALSQLVYNATIVQGQGIDLSNATKGIYLVKIYDNGKLLKQEKIVLD